MAQFDIVIHGGRLIDGTGNPWFYGDLAIKDGKIAQIGKIDPKTATRAKPKAPKSSSTRVAARKKPTKAAVAKTAPEEESKPSGAADALAGLLESPLVADVLAAGAAAALASITHHRLTRRRQSSSKEALKEAAKSAAAAMGARLSEEFEEILESAKKAKPGAR